MTVDSDQQPFSPRAPSSRAPGLSLFTLDFAHLRVTTKINSPFLPASPVVHFLALDVEPT